MRRDAVTAAHLVAAGVDITVIRSWPGHVSLDTTNRYAQANLETKRKALERVGRAVRAGKLPRWRHDHGILEQKRLAVLCHLDRVRFHRQRNPFDAATLAKVEYPHLGSGFLLRPLAAPMHENEHKLLPRIPRHRLPSAGTPSLLLFLVGHQRPRPARAWRAERHIHRIDHAVVADEVSLLANYRRHGENRILFDVEERLGSTVLLGDLGVVV
jgi:hypothetical protein